MIVEFESGVDQTVVFRCRHERQDAIIFWKLNGSQSSLYPDVVRSSVVEMGVRVDTLTVPVIPAYNNTEVVCSAIVDGTIEDSPTALFTVLGKAITFTCYCTHTHTHPSTKSLVTRLVYEHNMMSCAVDTQ